MPKQTIDLNELIQLVRQEARGAWRYRWHALVVAWGVMIVGAILVFGLPNQYEAKAQVYADTQALANPLLRGIAVQPDVRAQLDIITHTLLSRPNLQQVTDDTGLSVRATTPADKEELLTHLGKAVSIQGAGATNLYNITYTDPDRGMAQKVVQSFLQILMNSTLGANSAATATAQKFLQQQVTDYGKRLSDAEQQLADFKKANAAFLPDQRGGSYMSRLQDAEGKLLDLQTQYAAAKAGHGGGGRYINSRVHDIDAQIAELHQKINKLLLSYTEEYPDVVTAKNMIARLQAQRAEAVKGGGTYVASGGGSGAGSLAAAVAQQQRQVADLKAGVDKAADVQATMTELSRNYDTTKKQYDELVTRLNTAQLSQDATQSGNNLKFRVIDPPVVPLTPASPMRGLLLLLVFVLALAIGAVFAWFMHKIKPVFINLERLREIAGYPVLGAISLVVSQMQSEQRRREIIRFGTGAGLLALVLVVGLVFSGPLSRLVQHFFVLGGAA